MPPLVSILLPCLNSRRWLEGRMETILGQTLGDWELVVADSASDDGSWEFFQECAAGDERMRLFRVPRAGLYRGWNDCLERARGRYVYFATSDDTMSPTLLETMTGALDRHPEADLAHCRLTIIDETGAPHPTRVPWDRFWGTLYFGDLIERTHLRLPPHDGVLHAVVGTVYTSMTQLLIRRNLFDRIGGFRTDLGTVADFEWGMRASLVAATLHVPGRLATWRVHPTQATDDGALRTPQHLDRLAGMVRDALAAARKVGPALIEGLSARELASFYARESVRTGLEGGSRRGRLAAVARGLWSQPGLVTGWALSRAVGRSAAAPPNPLDEARRLVARYGLERNLVPLDE
jgi:glycosyltransferase involved in cell wall biosynthesis